MTVRVGVVGTGFGARVVAPVFAGTPGCEVVDVVSARDDAGVARLCDRDDVDLLSVHSPPFLHAAHVRRGIARDHAVLCDKPFGISSLEAEPLVAAADAAECLHLLNFEFRYPLTKRLRLVPFYDLGNVFRRVGDISWANMTNTVGLGLRVDTPVGPIGVDYGFLIDPPAFVTQSGAVLRQPRGAFHIRFGQTF